jgi:cell division protein FtsQ
MILRLAAWLFALALVALPVVAVLNGWFAAERWPIERLRLNAAFERVDEQAVREAVAPELADGYFAVDLDRVRLAVAALPWVDAVEVRKHWPDLVEITLIEHRAYARWGSDRLVSERGVLFAAPEAAQLTELPHLEAPDSRLDEVLRMHREVESVLARHRLAMTTLRLSARGSWSLVTSDGARIMAGRGDPLPRLARFAAALPRLRAVEPRALERADLRYANGFSLRWGDGPGLGTRDAEMPGPAAPSHESAPTRFGANHFPAARQPALPGPGSRVPGPVLWNHA